MGSKYLMLTRHMFKILKEDVVMMVRIRFHCPLQM